MASTSCPNCGKPLRPGAKFCGYCGATVTPAAAAAAPPESAATAQCPHCGKPVRPGAKFCSHCGQAIEPAPVAEPQEAAAAPPPPPMPAAAGPVSRPPAKVAQPRPRRRGLALVVVFVLILGCVAFLGAGLWVANAQGWIVLWSSPTPTASETATLTATALAQAPSETPTSGLEATPTEAFPTDTPSLPPGGGETPTEPSPPSPVLPTIAVFEETFAGDLRTNWRPWGRPLPRLEDSPTGRYLSLNAEKPYEAGASTLPELPLTITPGAEIAFEARLNPTYPNNLLQFDLDRSGLVIRNPEVTNPGLIHLVIRREEVLFSAPPIVGVGRQQCRAPLDGRPLHTYRVRLVSEQIVELWVDDATAPLCRLEQVALGTLPFQGTITFSGLGWVTSVRLFVPSP